MLAVTGVAASAFGNLRRENIKASALLGVSRRKYGISSQCRLMQRGVTIMSGG